MRILGRRYDTAQVVALEVAGDRIVTVQRLEPADLSVPLDQVPWVAPGLIDLQVNGFGGQEFTDSQLALGHVARISRSLDACGVTGYCPTVTTHSFQRLSSTLATIAAACRTDWDVAARVVGIHLEGPYLSAEDGPRGAHRRDHCRPPDWDEFQRLQEASDGRIRLLTMSPEYDGAPSFIRRVAATGVVVAIGHTAARSDQIRAAVDAGARLSTHLGNGAHARLARHPNYIWDQLAEDRLMASLIVDGHHLPPSVVQCFVRAKGPERCILVSDITGMAGMPPGRYDSASLGAVEVLDDGRLVVAGQREYLAGAARPISVGVANIMRFAGVGLKTAIEMATSRPADLVGQRAGRLEVGQPADLVLFDLPRASDPSTGLVIRATIKRGAIVHGQLSRSA